MQDFEKLGVFYLGRESQSPDNLLLYDSKDLVTHAVCVGMTGSGKTGLCLSLLEEAAIDSIPALMIDPKGDLANLLLQFPNLSAEEFRPWINEEEAKQQGVTPDAFAQQQADLWKNGLAKWGQSGERIKKLLSTVDLAIYTPGSQAGLPLSIIKSFAPPDTDDTEAVRDRVTTTATALLGLLGIDADPVKSREHILLSQILGRAWAAGRALDLAAIITAIQQPGFQKIGVMDVESFYPAKDRFELATALNNLLASPGFEAWMEGEPLDIQSLLYTPQGKPRMTVLSIAHLSDSERMFFVSLLLNEFLAWTRKQSGTTSLRAILYMDEIFGYFPPIANPPSKKPLLTLLKQARAYGVGVMLATQNPVDLDYKGLGNTGTWFIGRLQTERDKDRLLEGLESATAEAGKGFDRAGMDKLLSSLGKRVFLMNNVHENAPVVFESRWALSYLRGPLTRAQIQSLMKDRKAALPAAVPKAALPSTTGTRPVLPPEIPQYFMPSAAHDPSYHPRLFAAASIRFSDDSLADDYLRDVSYLVPIDDDANPINWETAYLVDTPPDGLETEPASAGTYADLPSAAAIAKNYAKWQKDYVVWLTGEETLTLFRGGTSGAVSEPGETEAAFRQRIGQSVRESRDAQIEALRAKYASKTNMLQDRLLRAQQAEAKQKQQSQGQWLGAAVTVGSSVLGALFGGGRRSTTDKAVAAAGKVIGSLNRARTESGDVDRASETVEAVQEHIKELEAEVQNQIDQIPATGQAEFLETLNLKAKKTAITVKLVALAWSPE
ncbi:MAG: hypothetical protein K2X03_24005 [Bryobacteraceae bacterium]|nr:hypothetical protein [Bryobacteraceae bacterium]